MDDSNPHELIAISFSLRDQVSDYFYHIDNEIILPRKDKYLVQTRSQVRSSGIRIAGDTWCKQRFRPTHATQVNKSHFLFRPLTKECLHIPSQSPELVKVEED